MASGLPSGHQKKLGPAPIASFEDLSDEVENGESTARMPGIVEVTTPVTPGSSLKTPSTPRIDISRASSSSHHEDSNNSRESSPERELLAGADPPTGCKLNLGYKEDVQDLRSSTEELDLQDPIHAQDLKRDAKRARRKKEDGTQSECGGSLKHDRERKDSNCSEIILLNISGRTSRLSSVGSQGSGVSGKLSVVSATSSRSPSPHKCLLETSFCGSKPTLADNLIEPSKPETDDLEKILLKREADTTKALIPESIKVPMVGGNLKPDPLDKPRRRGREERKEIFKREVEITKKVLEKVNIEVPIIRKPPPHKDPDEQSIRSGQEIQKPATLDLNDKRKKVQNFKDVVQTTPSIGSLSGSPKLPRHQKVRELEGSRTPSPSSVSRKSSFASLFKSRTDGSVLSPESPTPSAKPRRSITSKIRDTTESLRSRSKSRERVSIDKGSTKNKNVFTSTLSLFKKRERKKSTDDLVTPEHDVASGTTSLDSIGPVEFRFEGDRPGRTEDSIFISLHADSRNYEEALPSESVSIPLETPTKLLDEYDSEPRTGSIITEASIEHHRVSVTRIRTEARIESSIPREDSQSPLPQSASKDSEISKTSSRDSRASIQTAKHIDLPSRPSSSQESKAPEDQRIPSSSSRDSIEPRKPDIPKPKRKSKEVKEIPQTIQKPEKLPQPPVQPPKESKKQEELARLEDILKPQETLVKTPSVVSDLDHNSSESERDSEIDFIRNKAAKAVEELPDERKGLFNEESFEEDLPYVPTTLPLEKSVAVPMLPVKQRIQEVKTIPIERPRSTTPINPTLLDEFVLQTAHDEKRVERMKISLPREDSFKLKSPRKHATNTFSEFAGRVAPDSKRSGKTPSPPPPLPPRAAPRPSNWINFEEIPERRKAPKRIQTIPRAEDEPKGYSYVQPEECRCECHEESRRASTRDPTSGSSTGAPSITGTSSCSSSNGDRNCNGENCNVPSNSGDRASIVSDSSLECSLSIEEGTGTQALLGTGKPFSMDLDVGSNRSSIISQEEADEAHQP
ncbi:microtubule-associated protein futsch isoform X1 [Diachasmimorpha longicaudata]|uniref:microtubule-associated protein futsch isoform X1 n=1 Tax=Diachasmimorpha longicaudata TaxID=58733 RepID=UPI0030B8A099